MIICGAIITVQVTSATANASGELPANILESLKENALNLNPNQTEWTVERTRRMQTSSLAKLLGSKEEDLENYMFKFKDRATCAIDGDKIKVRFVVEYLTNSAGQNIVVQQERQLSYDGTHIYYEDRFSDGTKGSLLIYNREHAIKTQIELGPETKETQRWRTNYWKAAGFSVPTSEFETSRPGITSTISELIAQKAARVEFGEAMLGGEKCQTVTVSTSTGKQMIYLDAKLHYAVRRLEKYDAKNRVILTTTADDFRSVPAKGIVYLPFKVKVEYFQLISKPAVPSKDALFDENYTLVSYKNVPTPADEFELKPEVGMIVGDDRLPTAAQRKHGLVHYEMPASKSDMDDAIRHAIEGKPFIPRELRESSTGRRLLICINVLVILVLCVAIWYFRKRRKASA